MTLDAADPADSTATTDTSPGSPGPSADPGRRRRPIRPADLCRLRSVADVALHPAGEAVVFTVAWPDADTDANRSVLEVGDVDGGSRRRLSDGHADHHPRFSPSGQRLAFLRSSPKGPTRVAVSEWPSGVITEVASMPDGVDDVRWAGDDRLIMLAPRRPDHQVGVDDEELARRPRIATRNDYRFNGRGWTDRPNQVWVIDLDPAAGSAGRPEEAAKREIGPSGIDHRAIAVSPDGGRVAAIAAADDDRDQTGADDVWLLTIQTDDIDSGDNINSDNINSDNLDSGDGTGTGTGTERGNAIRLTPPGGMWADLAWHPEGPLVAVGRVDGGQTGFARPHLLTVPDLNPSGLHQPGIPEPLNDADQHISTSAGARGLVAVEGGFLFPGARRGRVAVDRHGLDGSFAVVYEDANQVHAFDATSDGSVIVGAVTSPTRPAELWRLDGQTRRLAGFNDHLLAELDLAEVSEVTTVSADGTEVHGFVTRPPASAPEPGPAGRPGLIYIHGGPMFQYGLYFFDEFQMAAALGYVVIGGNPRGSDGYGEAWAQAILGDLGNLDFDDVTALADHLAADPDVDADRLGIGGGSYGGFMTGWALARDKRFRAGLIERAVTSWTTMYGTSDIGSWFNEVTIGATLEDNPEEVRRQSPLSYAADITAPTMVLHSEEDWRCPIEQAEQMFAAIRRNGGDATLVRFPGENHELSRSGRPSHRIERFEIVHEFFARHVGGADFGSTHLE